MKKSSVRFEPKDGECHACAAEGRLPSQAVSCHLHSTLVITELQAEIAVLKDTASASSRLHLALAALYGAVPSPDGSEELRYVTDLGARLDRVEKLIEHVLLVAQWDDDAARDLIPALFPSRPPKKR